MTKFTALLVVAFTAALAAHAEAQRLPFERSFDVGSAAAVDIWTMRGRIDVGVGEPGRIVVRGTVTVRVAWDAPPDAVEIAKRIADRPPVERDGETIRLRAPADALERRAVTVSYRVIVPPDTRVSTDSESGATTIRGVAGAVVVRTQSAAIDLSGLRGGADVTTGSGAVSIDDVSGPLAVVTGSSAFTGRALRGDVSVRTRSGAVDAGFAGPGYVDVSTGSSSISLRGVRGGLNATSRSGRVMVEGTPQDTWDLSTGSGGVDVTIAAASPITLDAGTGSGSVRVEMPLEGSVTKRSVTGTILGGGPVVRAISRSGSIRVAGR
jgi:hypothetical protein